MTIIDFSEQKYLEEMQILVETAKDEFVKQHSDKVVYTINIWTDIDAEISAVNFDDFENSSLQVESLKDFFKRAYNQYVAEGDIEMSKVSLSLPPQSRNINPADFQWREFSTIEHQCFGSDWEYKLEDECWDVLEPALLQVGAMAKAAFSILPLHREAELSVNSRRDWYDQSWLMNDPNVSD